MTLLHLPLALLALASQSGPGQVTTFVGLPGGIGDVLVAPEDGLAPALPVAGLTGVQLLPIDAAGRSALTALLPDQPRLRLDVAGGARVLLPTDQGSLYRFRRDEVAGGATFGFFHVDAGGAATVVLELPGAGTAADLDPFLERVGVDAAGTGLVIGTTSAAGGDLYEVDLATGVATNRTTNLSALTLNASGGRLLATWGVAVAQEGILRFARTPGAQGELVAITGIAAPTYWDGGVAISADSSMAGTVAGSAPTAAHVICLGATGAAHPLDTTPTELKGAGFSPASTAGPYLALSTDGTAASWVQVQNTPGGKKREAWMARTTPLPGEVPQQLTGDASFIDTLDETGLIGFVSGGTMVIGVGEVADPLNPALTGIDNMDLYTATLNPDGTTTVQNLSLTSGIATQPFGKGEISTDHGAYLVPGGDFLVLDRAQELIGRVQASLPGLQPLLPQTKDVISVERAGGSLLVHARHSTASIDQCLYAYDVATGALTHFASLPSGVAFERHALRSDGTTAFVVRLAGKEWLARVDLATVTGGFATTLPLAFGPALGFTPGGGLALTVGVPGAPAYQLVWTAVGGVTLLPAPLVPAQMLPGAS